MKVYLDYEFNNTGKGKFLQRLCEALRPMGVKFTDDPKKASVALGISKWRNKVKLPKVLRIDGIRIQHDRKAAWYNNEVRKSIKDSDGVVFQSAFSQKYVCKKLKLKEKCGVVIHNGVVIRDEKHVVAEPLGILMVGNWGGKKWRKHKRGVETLSFVKWFLDRHPHHVARIAGQTPSVPVEHERLHYLGTLGDESLWGCYRASAFMLNLTDLDWCPNATVEALGAGVPVVCYSKTAVAELVEKGCPVHQQIEKGAGYLHIEKICMDASVWKVDPRRYDIQDAARLYKKEFERVAAK